VSLATLEITDFRCIANARLDFDSRCSLLVGENAAGKTSVLEAISVLSSGRSFRSNHLANLIRTGQSQFLLAGSVSGTEPMRLAVQASATHKDIHVAGKKSSSFAPLAAALPVLVIDPSAHKLLEDGPGRRRRFLDWGTFHVEPRFVTQWRRYERALRHRNAALKSQQSSALVRSWDEELISAGTQIADFRADYMNGLEPFIKLVVERLLGGAIDLVYIPGWRDGINFKEALGEAWGRDVRQKVTTVGPHRADFQIRFDGFSSKDRISRGQQKLLACALIVAQLQYRSSIGSGQVCLLLDDPAAELDVDNLKKLLQIVTEIAAQLIVTAIELNGLRDLPIGKMFHVKQDGITPMV